MGRLAEAGWAPVLLAVGLSLAPATPAAAHGFGQRYGLPIPLPLYVAGAAAAVACSFVVVGLFVRRPPGRRGYPRRNLLGSPAGRLLAHPILLASARLVSLALFVLLVGAGLVGNQHPMKNIAPTLVWVLWWIGLAFVSALAGNLWALISPWETLFRWAEILYRRVNPRGALARRIPYPEALGVWPGALLFFAFAWVELVSDASAVPASLAIMTLAYSAVTWLGMFLFGREVWRRRGEAFALAFGLLARFAPTEVRVVGPDVCAACGLGCRDRDGECIDCYECFARAGPMRREWNVRPWAVGLARSEAVSSSTMVFVLLLLSTVSFDGFLATPLWASVEDALYAALPALGGGRLAAVRTLGLAAFPALFLGVYLAVAWAMAAASGRRFRAGELARTFVQSLVPIAIAYHLAHYLAFLVTQGQLIVPLASDPFGFGWDLLGTARYRMDIGVVGARFEWFTAVAAIVLGHIVAVYLAHLIALRVLGDRALAVKSQYPMLLLMVGYTMLSLWILAQPIVAG